MANFISIEDNIALDRFLAEANGGAVVILAQQYLWRQRQPTAKCPHSRSGGLDYSAGRATCRTDRQTPAYRTKPRSSDSAEWRGGF
jgi:hypothetical protein